MTDKTLHQRLEALGQKIRATEERLRRDAHLYRDSTHLMAQELRERHARVTARVHSAVADAEAHGHHVSDLERSVRQWLDSVDAEHTATQ